MCEVFRKIKPSVCRNSKLWFRYKSVAPPLFLRTKVDAAPIEKRSSTDFAPTLHRLWYGGRAKEERKKNGSKTLSKRKNWLMKVNLFCKIWRFRKKTIPLQSDIKVISFYN